MTETIAAADEERLEELEAGFLSWEAAPAVRSALARVAPAELSAPGAVEAAAARTVHSTSRKCC
jgi:hypothetical protein